MRVTEWLQKPSEVTRAKGFFPYLTEQPSRLERLAELSYCNQGKWELQGYGSQTVGLGAYGRMGLTVLEAFEYLRLTGTFDGIIIGTNEDDRETAQKDLQFEIERVETCFMALQVRVEEMLAEGFVAVPSEELQILRHPQHGDRTLEQIYRTLPTRAIEEAKQRWREGQKNG